MGDTSTCNAESRVLAHSLGVRSWLVLFLGHCSTRAARGRLRVKVPPSLESKKDKARDSRWGLVTMWVQGWSVGLLSASRCCILSTEQQQQQQLIVQSLVVVGSGRWSLKSWRQKCGTSRQCSAPLLSVFFLPANHRFIRAPRNAFFIRLHPSLSSFAPTCYQLGCWVCWSAVLGAPRQTTKMPNSRRSSAVVVQLVVLIGQSKFYGSQARTQRGSSE